MNTSMHYSLMDPTNMDPPGIGVGHPGYLDPPVYGGDGSYILDLNMTYPDLDLPAGCEDPWGTMCIQYPGELKQIPQWEVAIKILFYVITIVVSIIGNTLVIFIVWKNKRMRTTTNYYIVNLAVSDLMVTVSCTWVHLVSDISEGWILGAFFCKFNSFAQVLSLVSSILTLMLISCDRFFGIIFAMKAHLTERRATSCLVVVWLCAGAVATPLLFYRQQFSRQWLDHTEVWCDDTWPPVVSRDAVTGFVTVAHPSRSIYYTFVCVMLFFIPIVVMSIAYAMIIWRLWSKRAPGERIESGTLAQNKVKRKVVVMLVVLLALFVICWLPLMASILYSEYRDDTKSQLPVWYADFQYVATFMAYFNSVLNPIVYAGFNEKFQRGFLALLGIKSRHTMRGSVSWRRDSSFRSVTMVTHL